MPKWVSEFAIFFISAFPEDKNAVLFSLKKKIPYYFVPKLLILNRKNQPYFLENVDTHIFTQTVNFR